MIELQEIPPEPIEPTSLPQYDGTGAPKGEGDSDGRRKIFGIPYPISNRSCQKFLWNCQKLAFRTAYSVIFPIARNKYFSHTSHFAYLRTWRCANDG